LASLFATAACGGHDVAASEPIPLVTGGSRFEISFEPVPPATGDAIGEIRLYVETLNDWHIAPDAPAWLRMQDSEEIIFAPAERVASTGESDMRLDFATSYRASPASRAIETVAHGRVKFGMCEGDALQCIIVERDLVFPLDLGSKK
jgi:hypothetical protein